MMNINAQDSEKAHVQNQQIWDNLDSGLSWQAQNQVCIDRLKVSFIFGTALLYFTRAIFYQTEQHTQKNINKRGNISSNT